jgi:hypothetical protein
VTIITTKPATIHGPSRLLTSDIGTRHQRQPEEAQVQHDGRPEEHAQRQHVRRFQQGIDEDRLVERDAAARAGEPFAERQERHKLRILRKDGLASVGGSRFRVKTGTREERRARRESP